MKLQYFLDTDTFIYIKNHHPPQVLERFSSMEPGSAGISVITYGELIRGAERSDYRQQNLDKLKHLTRIIPVHPMPPDTGIYYGTIRAGLEKTGQIIGNNDLWIAAHALAMNITVITNNTGEFARVKNLNIENWV